ncbi:unnamed protein product [Prunus armeniaca]|uniref:Uncharacterized protein n=1 Tax=Prunus armeniaca TaxID=36596 RepID=A0A6J5VD97_PRUAR|nr:unnamed protein product [Prunus armeniaca]
MRPQIQKIYSIHPCQTTKVEQTKEGFKKYLPQHLPNLPSQPKLKLMAFSQFLPNPALTARTQIGLLPKRPALTSHDKVTSTNFQSHPCRSARALLEPKRTHGTSFQESTLNPAPLLPNLASLCPFMSPQTNYSDLAKHKRLEEIFHGMG